MTDKELKKIELMQESQELFNKIFNLLLLSKKKVVQILESENSPNEVRVSE